MSTPNHDPDTTVADDLPQDEHWEPPMTHTVEVSESRFGHWVRRLRGPVLVGEGPSFHLTRAGRDQAVHRWLSRGPAATGSARNPSR